MVALLGVSAFAAEDHSRSECERDSLWRWDSMTDASVPFGLVPWSKRRWAAENPTADSVDPLDEWKLTDALSSNVWARKPGTRLGLGTLAPRLSRAHEEMERGHYEAVYTRLVYLARWASHAEFRQLRQIHDLMGRLAAALERVGDRGCARRIYEEMLLVGHRLAPEYTVAALNQLIARHSDRGDYEAALMYARVGVAVLGDVGLATYHVMNRIIGDMSSSGTAVDALEHDFDKALARLESAVASAEDQGLMVEDQWWAPVYRARHDREEAIRILRAMLAPMRDDSRDVLRGTSVHEGSVP